MGGIDSGLEPHIKFGFQRRLKEELTDRDPPQPYPGDPLPEEIRSSAHTSVRKSRGLRTLPRRRQEQEQARLAVQRTMRFRAIQSEALRRRLVTLSRSPTSRAAIKVANGGRFDAALIEDRDYELNEVIGAESLFKLRLVTWGGR
jgi:hypothetical protein